jgi:hypothetical protein
MTVLLAEGLLPLLLPLLAAAGALGGLPLLGLLPLQAAQLQGGAAAHVSRKMARALCSLTRKTMTSGELMFMLSAC